KDSTYFISYTPISNLNDTIIKYIIYNNELRNKLMEYNIVKINNNNQYSNYNTRIINDSLIISVGSYGDPLVGFTGYDGYAHILNLNTNLDTLINMGSSNRIDFVSDV